VKGVVGTSIAFRVSSFAIAVVFIGFDPDNLSVGAVASFEDAPGIAWGAIIGAAMVAVAFGFAVAALLAPMRFGAVPVRILMVPLLAITFLGLTRG
jgi:Ca2+/Na+ antiporter